MTWATTTTYALMDHWNTAGAARQLPWRTDLNLARKTMVEGLLAQTTASTVAEHYGRVFAGITTGGDWLDLKREEQLERVAPMGLPRTKFGAVFGLAKTLHRSIDGRLSREAVDDLQTFPYIGPYTAGMVALLHGHEAAPVDCNVQRVGQRAHGDGSAEAWIGDVMARAVQLSVGYEVISAVLDLGATICVPYSPDCYRCPLRASCTSAERIGRQLVMFSI